MMGLVSIFMDVEDPINPLADDAALDFARLFTEAGVRGSFCITGEKCRKLIERGRQDVIEAFRPHCLGLHTDTHSYHPTTMELLADLGYEEGCRAALEAESKGCEAFQRAFGRLPAFWGGAGNTWSPEIPFTLKELNIPAYVYSLTEVLGGDFHRFNGAFALPQSASYPEDSVIEEPPIWKSPNRDWTGVFVGHPTRYRFPDYWDRSYYAGQTPETLDLQSPISEDRYRSGLANMKKLLSRIAVESTVIGVDDFLQMPWKFRDPNAKELGAFAKKTSENIRNVGRWPIHKPDLSVDRIIEKTLALYNTLEVRL